MIRKLRWKFVAVCMGLVALVLSAVFGAAYHAVRQNIEDLSRQMLYQVLREDSGRGAVPNPTIEIGGDRVLLPYFTVNIWGGTAYITGGTYANLEDTDALRDILSQCLEQNQTEGTVEDYHLRYLVEDNGLYRKLAFVDMSMEQATLARVIRSYLVIALAALLFGLFRSLSNVYTGFDFLAQLNLPSTFYNMLPYIISLLVLALTSSKSRAPKAEGIPYDKGSR